MRKSKAVNIWWPGQRRGSPLFFLICTLSLKEEAVPTEEVNRVNSSVKEKSNISQPDTCHPENLNCLNYCIPGILSRCGAGPKVHEQKKCRYYRKSSIRDQCMHYIVALNGHCDCVDAQRDVRRQQGPGNFSGQTPRKQG
jgi:hypothetical protein